MKIVEYVDDSGRVPFRDWLENLQDLQGRARIRSRLLRMAEGNLGECRMLRSGVMELKVDFGPGYRVYLSRQGSLMILLLCGSDKSDQDRAINQAID
jgi:putative addiction module killer protein